MKKLTALLTALCCFTFSTAWCQQSSVKGTITDTLNKQNLSNAVISVLRAKDSILLRYSRSDLQGHFTVQGLPAIPVVVLVTYPNYADYTDTFTIAAGKDLNLGTIPLITKAHLLEEVVVKQTVGAIKMKGDTMEYKADSFHVEANANVEELLKKMPGIQVDKNGQITAQGQKVQKVLVDGEEFFGDDPTLVTQNIRADMVDKVQVYDKKSEQAAFTGIDDGEKTRTLNLKLKDDKKKGFFGKADLGAGTEGYYNEQLMFNRFRKKEKFSAFGILSNTGKTGLNWQDQRSYGDNSTNIAFMDGGDVVFMGSGGDDLEGWGGNYNGQGYPKVKTGGLHYDNKWNDDKQTINGNYKILNLGVTGSNTTSTQYILPDTVYYNNQTQQFKNEITRNKLNGSYAIDFDSTSNLKILADGGFDHKITNNLYTSDARASDQSLVNQGNRSINTVGDNNSFNTSLLWRKKLKKKGRTISLNVKENYSTTVSTGYLYADNQYYKGGIQVGQQITDQLKTTNTKALAFDSRLTYTEPLSKVSSLIVNYGITLNNSSSTRNSFNKSGTGKYDTIDSVYSNDYTYNILTQRGGLNYSMIKKKVRVNLGNSVGYTSYNQVDHQNNLTGNRNFVNWFPNANMSYSFTSQRQLSLYYNGSTSQPSLQQIQPLKTNDDPLNIVVGNPDLKPSFRNNISLSYYDFKAMAGKDFYMSANFSSTNNAFANKEIVDSIGRRYSQAINVDGNRNYSIYANYGFKFKKTNIGLNTNYNASRFVNIVNNLENITNSQTVSFGTYVARQVEKVYDNSISANASYTTSTSSIQSNISTHYWTFNISPNFDFYLPGKTQLHTECDFIFRQKTSAFDQNNNVILWSGWIGKKLLKGDAMLIKLQANDILNRNIGFNRSVNTNFITQNTYSTIQRYFMLSLVWNFKSGGTAAPSNN
ncbi:MAG TPA: outer membrane beta-barrel protein [Sediminibacterium sp.]|nr:outer membrane beta-barrel protein [Sediminibacterium sp.]